MKLIFFQKFLIILIFCLFSQIFSMERDLEPGFRNRKNNCPKNSLIKTKNNSLQQGVISNFEDHQLIGEYDLTHVVPGKIFPKEIWLEIINYLDFKDPALVYYFAPRIEITKGQAEKIAFEIYNFVIKNANNFEHVDFKLKKILSFYHRRNRELISNFIDLIFDNEYKNVKYPLGVFPIIWLCPCPSSIQDDISKLKSESYTTCQSFFKFTKDTIQEEDIARLKKFSFKLKKIIFMFEYFQSKKYQNILKKFREHIFGYTVFMMFSAIIIGFVLVNYNYSLLAVGVNYTSLGALCYVLWVILDKETLADKVKGLNQLLIATEKLMEKLKSKLNSKDKITAE